jgi:hypothetical protein
MNPFLAGLIWIGVLMRAFSLPLPTTEPKEAKE